ncbi:MAG: cell division protein FtsA [Deltaproteobacteria bacterium]|nr:cell division protein FtsA [Deltaproteobacteria bacterium]
MASHKKGKGEIVVGLDIGTTKICAVVGEVLEDGVEIIGIGTHPSVGLRKGVVVNIEATVNSIKQAVEEAELMAGCEISSVFAGIAGGHIQSLNSHGIIAVKSREVSQSDIERVIEAAKAVSIPMDREVIHTLPQEYIVDDQDGILDPKGMTGVRLEVRVHIITGAVTSAHNLIKCCNRAGLDVCDIVLESLASAEAVLTEDEKDLGAVLIDFGGGTTDLAVFLGGTIRHTSVLSLGGINLTKDIAIGLRTPDSSAEKIKKRYGSCLANRIGRNETIEVPSTGGRKPRVLSRQILGEIIEPRVEEILTLTDRELARSGFKELASAGMVITGGSALIEGLSELAEQVSDLPTRIGYPQGVAGLTDVINNPMYSTAVGLVLLGAKGASGRKFRIRDQNTFNKVISRMRDWFKEVF